MLLQSMEQKVDKNKNKDNKILILANPCTSMQIILIYMNLNPLFVDFVVMCLFVAGLKILMILVF